MKTASGLLAALALALAACTGSYPLSQPLSCPDCVNLSGEGPSNRLAGNVTLAWFAAGPYSCSAEVNGNTYRNERGELAAGDFAITIGAERIIDERAAAGVFTGSFAERGGEQVIGVGAEPRARWSLACEPDAARRDRTPAEMSGRGFLGCDIVPFDRLPPQTFLGPKPTRWPRRPRRRRGRRVTGGRAVRAWRPCRRAGRRATRGRPDRAPRGRHRPAA